MYLDDLQASSSCLPPTCEFAQPDQTLLQLLSKVDYLRAAEAAILKPGVQGICHVGDEWPVTLPAVSG